MNPEKKSKDSAVPSTPKSNDWIGEQAGPWGGGLLLREGHVLNSQKNTGKASDGAAWIAKQLNIEKKLG